MPYVSLHPGCGPLGSVVQAEAWPTLHSFLITRKVARVPWDMVDKFCQEAKSASVPSVLTESLPEDCSPFRAAQAALEGRHPPALKTEDSPPPKKKKRKKAS